MVLKKVYRKQTGRFEYALVSKTDPNKILFWFGKKPSKEEFQRQEKRVQFFKNRKGWFGNSKLHALAARGFKVRRVRKNYGSKMFREQIKKEVFSGPGSYIDNLNIIKDIEKRNPDFKGSKFIDDPKFGQRILIRTIEKNPDLLKDLRGKDIFFYESQDSKTPLGFAKGRTNLIGIDRRMVDPENMYLLQDSLTKSIRDFTFQDALKHEVAHLKQQKINPYLEPKLAEIAADYAIHTNLRKEKPRKQLMDRSISNFFSREVPL